MRVGLVGDVHGRVLLLLAALAAWQRRAGHRFDLIIQVGDMGAFPDLDQVDRSIRLPLESVYVPSPLGVPVVRPEILLFYKARSLRPKEEHDFRMLRDRLTEAQRFCLRTHLARLQSRDPWLSELK